MTSSTSPPCEASIGRTPSSAAFDPLGDARLQDLVAAKHRIDDLVAERRFHRRERGRLALERPDEAPKRLGIERLDRAPVDVDRRPRRLVPGREQSLEPLDVADESGEIVALGPGPVKRVQGQASAVTQVL